MKCIDYKELGIEKDIANKLKRLAIEWVFAKHPLIDCYNNDEEYSLAFDNLISGTSSQEEYIERSIYDCYIDIRIPLIDIYHCMIETIIELKK